MLILGSRTEYSFFSFSALAASTVSAALVSGTAMMAEAPESAAPMNGADDAAAEETGYGVVSPSAEDMILEEPELVRQGGRYGVKLRATAPSLHIMKVDVATEVSPIVGTEQQGAEFVDYLAKELENDPQGIWVTNFFGKSLHDLVSEGMAGKASNMPKEAQTKMRKTLSKIVNEGKGGIICILL